MSKGSRRRAKSESSDHFGLAGSSQHDEKLNGVLLGQIAASKILG